MKIFGWMHHKIQLRRNYSLLSHENGGLEGSLKERKDIEIPIGMEKDTHALLMNNMTQMMENVPGWEDGILAIGTFGLHHLHLYEYEDQLFVEDVDDEKIPGEIEDHYNKGKDGEIFEEIGVVMNSAPTKDHITKPLLEEEIVVEKEPTPTSGDAIESTHKNMEGEKMKSNGRRITLADLFHAEGNPNSILPEKDDQMPSENAPPADYTMLKIKEKEHTKKQKHKKSLGKKLKNWKKGEHTNHNTPMLQKLMSRMLKKKIHPDFGGGSEAANMEIAGKLPGDLNGNLPCIVPKGDDSVSLLRATAITC